MSTYEHWAVAIGIASLLISLAGFVTLGIQLLVLRSQLRRGEETVGLDHRQRRRDATFQFILSTFGEFWELRANGLPSVNIAAQVEEHLASIVDWTAPDDPHNICISRYLGGWETVATGINIDAYDREIVNILRGPEAVRAWSCFEPWIMARRAAYGQWKLYEELETLAATTTNR